MSLRLAVRKSVLAKFNPNHDAVGRFASSPSSGMNPGRNPDAVVFDHERGTVTGTFYAASADVDRDAGFSIGGFGHGWQFTTDRKIAQSWAKSERHKNYNKPVKTATKIQIGQLMTFSDYDDKVRWEGEIYKAAGIPVEHMPGQIDEDGNERQGYDYIDWGAYYEQLQSQGVSEKQAREVASIEANSRVREWLEDHKKVGVAVVVPNGHTTVWLRPGDEDRWSNIPVFADPKTGKRIEPYDLKMVPIAPEKETERETMLGYSKPPEDPAEREKYLDKVAEYLGMSKEFADRHVQYGGKGYKFTVDGTEMTAAGSFTPGEDIIRIYNEGMKSRRAVAFVMAHEIGHLVYRGIRDTVKMEEDQGWRERALHPSGDVIDVTYEETKDDDGTTTVHMDRPKSTGREDDFPIYREFRDLASYDSKLMKKLEEAGGVSDYSRKYWSQYKTTGRTHDLDRAIDETLAEVAQIKFKQRMGQELDDDEVVPPAIWDKLETRMKKAWDLHLSWMYDSYENRPKHFARIDEWKAKRRAKRARTQSD